MKFTGVAFVIVHLLFSAMTFANTVIPVKARPRIAGDQIFDFKVEDITGNSKSFRKASEGKYIMLGFIPHETFGQKNLGAYFRTIQPFIEELGYEIFIITSLPSNEERALIYERKLPNLFIDRDKVAFIGMGLADSNEEGASVLPGIFFVSPAGKIMSQFSSADPQIQFSGDSLVLAARISRQIDSKVDATGFRNGPTMAPELVAPAPATNTVIETDKSFATPDESVLRLLTIEDIARTNSFWVQGGFGVTAYDARRNSWSPRWSPSIQIGRRYNRFGFFMNLALDQTFDLTQEVKHLDVIHLGPGIESLSMYGRIRSSLSTGLAILSSDTDIDSRGKIGWYFDLRPIALRWQRGRNGAIEVTPLSLNISVPVTRGIPLIQVGYMTTLSYEFATSVSR